MEEIMTQESNQVTSLSSWWDGISFDGKELYHLNENGDLILNSIGADKERVMGTVTAENADIVLRSLLEKFPEVEARMKELQTEWAAAEDKQKLIGKVERMKEYLKHTNAAGNFKNLLAPLAEMEKAMEAIVEESHKAKTALAEEAEKLANSDHWKETTQKFRDLTEQWKHTGHLDKHRSDELWNRIEAAKNNFFERKRQHHEDTEKEMLQNLDLKLELVEKAENMAASEEWKEVTETFKQLMEDWKKIGRTLPEKNEELWNRFINAKNVFYDRKKLHFESIQQEQEANYLLKIALVEKAEAMKDSHEWNKTSQAYADLMEEWKNIGRVPLEKAEEIWKRLDVAKDQFFQAKKQHFQTVKVSLEDNYAQKLALLKRAEDLQNSRNWREATTEINELMTEWKNIGPVPREHSNTIWEKFIGARRKFFERKDADREKRIQHVEKKRSARTQQTRHFLHKLEEEIADEQDRLDDFKNGIENITPGHKERELREHLQKLITQTEHKLAHKLEKLEEVKKQLNELEHEPDNHPNGETPPGETPEAEA